MSSSGGNSNFFLKSFTVVLVIAGMISIFILGILKFRESMEPEYIDEIIPAFVISTGQCTRYECSYTIRTDDGATFVLVDHEPQSVGSNSCMKKRTYINEPIIEYYTVRRC